MAKNVGKVAFVNFVSKETKCFTDAAKATSFVMSQLSSVDMDEVLKEELSWFGEECSVPASVLNTVLRGLEVVGLHENVIIVPEVGTKRYIIKPFMYDLNSAAVVSIDVNADFKSAIINNSSRYKRSYERVLDKLYSNLIADCEGAYIVKTASNRCTPCMELRYDIYFKKYDKDSDRFESKLSGYYSRFKGGLYDFESISGFGGERRISRDDLRNYLKMDFKSEQTDKDVLTKVIRWNPKECSDGGEVPFKEYMVADALALLVGEKVVFSDFKKDLSVLTDKEWLCGEID